MELVSVTTGDYVRLHGLYSRATDASGGVRVRSCVTAAVLVPGIGGNFYSSRLLNHFAETLERLGISTVRVNTRGHDMVNTVSWAGQARSVGAAFEDVDHCRFDLAAWHDFLVERGHETILFFGHSLGAIKSLYAQAHAADQLSSLRAIIGLSPSRLSYRRMLATSTDGLFVETFGLCQQLVQAGRGADPIQVPYPVKTWMTPQCYLDKYGPEEKYNWLNFIDRVSLPTMLLFGKKELEKHPGFLGLEQELEVLHLLESVEIKVVADADHFYSSKFPVVDELLKSWLCI